MISLSIRDRLRVGLAFGAAALASAGVAGTVAALAMTNRPVNYAADALRDAPGESAFVVAVVTGVTVLVGMRLADLFGEPARGRRGVVHPDAVQGLGVTLISFAISVFAVPLASAVFAPNATAAQVIAGTLFSGFVGLVMGSFTVLPVALVFGGLAGWLVGRSMRGTPAPAAGLDEDSPPRSHV